MTKPKADGWNHRSQKEDEIANINAAIDELQQGIIVRTNQRNAHDQAIKAAAETTIRRLETARADLIRQRNAGR